ncbi:hypothetical protein [Vibrio rarus]|uniref:hypothetical protein n=1 Tax=Vibrio rarus TaxID=413403 RepID=UPI0021C46D03|nr:hypothetical protein [Vibrio rarus]
MTKMIKSLTVLLALGLGFFANDIYHALQTPTDLDATHYCQLSTQPCNINNATITIAEDVVSPMQPVDIHVQWPSHPQAQIWVELEGKEMSMGTAKFVLAKQDDGSFAGQLLLPVCHSNAMTWIGSIRSQNDALPISVRMQK